MSSLSTVRCQVPPPRVSVGSPEDLTPLSRLRPLGSHRPQVTFSLSLLSRRVSRNVYGRPRGLMDQPSRSRTLILLCQSPVPFSVVPLISTGTGHVCVLVLLTGRVVGSTLLSKKWCVPQLCVFRESSDHLLLIETWFVIRLRVDCLEFSF